MISNPPTRNTIGDGSWLRWFARLTDIINELRTDVDTLETTVATHRAYSATIDPASVNANTIAEQTFTVTGLTTSDVVAVNKPTLTAGIGIVGARVSAANTIAISFINNTGGAIDPPSETYLIIAVET